MPLINCKVKLKQRKTNYCVLASTGVGHDGTGYNDFIFTINDTQLYVPVVTFSAKGNQKLSNHLSKRFEISVYWNEYKTKSENKNTKNEYRYFLQSNFVGVSRLFFLIHSNQDDIPKRCNVGRSYLPGSIIKNYNIIITEKNFFGQHNDFPVKGYKEIRKLTTEQGEDYTTGCMLDYEYIKNYYLLIAVDCIKGKELNTDPRSIRR